MPDNFLGVDTLAVDHSGDLPVRATGIKADPAAVHVTADGLGALVGSGTLLQRQIQNLQRTLVELLNKIVVKGTLTCGGVGFLQLLSDGRRAADVDTETTDGPQQELHVPLHIAIIGIKHSLSAVNKGVAHRDQAVVPLHSDGNGLGSTLAVCICPNAEGDKLRIQGRNMFQFIVNA